MKTTKLILLAIFAAIALFACDDKSTVYPEPWREPVKALDIAISKFGLYATSDGAAATLVNVGQTEDFKKYVIAKIGRNGNVTLSDTVYMYREEDYWDYCSFNVECYIGPSGDILLNNFTKEEDNNDYTYYYIHTRLDKDGKITCSMSEDEEGSWLEHSNPYPIALLDNGEMVGFKTCEVSTIGANGLVMNRYNNDGTIKNLSCVMEYQGNGMFERAKSFENKIVLYNEQQLSIFNIDGSFVKTINFDKSKISDINYIDGNIYVFSRGDSLDYNNNVYFVTKTDTLGNQLFSIEIKRASSLYNCIVQGDRLIVTASAMMSEAENYKMNGKIYLIDNINGNYTDTITCQYNGCDMVPRVISLDRHGEYDVFAARFQDYDDCEKLFIYHTDDLHKLQMK